MGLQNTEEGRGILSILRNNLVHESLRNVLQGVYGTLRNAVRIRVASGKLD